MEKPPRKSVAEGWLKLAASAPTEGPNSAVGAIPDAGNSDHARVEEAATAGMQAQPGVLACERGSLTLPPRSKWQIQSFASGFHPFPSPAVAKRLPMQLTAVLRSSHLLEKKSKGVSSKEDHKADDCLHEHSPCSSTGVACSSKLRIAKKQNCQIETLLWTLPVLASF